MSQYKNCIGGMLSAAQYLVAPTICRKQILRLSPQDDWKPGKAFDLSLNLNFSILAIVSDFDIRNFETTQSPQSFDRVDR